ncbi:DoxX family membrane protein [Candidatus Uhrbacteria bacterium]|nr:DoxX family membrane protein [Candidatus Uhrbacteria bacterium]
MSLLRFRDSKTLVILRLAVGSLFLGFGIEKLIRPEAWYGWVPSWFTPLLPVSLATFMFLNGLFEIALGAALLLGRFTRLAAAAAGLFLFGIILSIGANDVIFRDSVIMGACLAIIAEANGTAKKPLSAPALRRLAMAYALFVLVLGVLYVRG